MKRVLLIGGRGYIGSLFCEWFANVYDITVVDIGWFTPDYGKESRDYRNYNDLAGYDAIILLAGHSSVRMCETSDQISSFSNNVTNFVELLGCIPPGVKFIYASSSSVYGNVGNGHATENMTGFTPLNLYDISKYVIDLYAQKSDVEYYGLRFGTVNGYSPHLRVDVMINAMTYYAKEFGAIHVYNKHINRPILYIGDLMLALSAIIESSKDRRGIYNLSTFDAVVDDIAKEVADVLSVPIKEYTIGHKRGDPKVYDFNISSEKFKDMFDFEFSDISSGEIAKEIVDLYDNIKYKTHRNDGKLYM